MLGKLVENLFFGVLLLGVISLQFYHQQVHATASEDAVLEQLKLLWRKATCNQLKEWVVSVNPCSGPWPGVACALRDGIPADATHQVPCSINNSNCTVIALRLPNCGLVGEIPFILAGLPNLQALDLHGNFLVGEITSELLNTFANLTYLDLSSNYLNGTIPQMENQALVVSWESNCFLSNIGDCHLDAGMRELLNCRNHTSISLQPCRSWARQHFLVLIVLLLVCPFATIILVSLLILGYYWRAQEFLPQATTNFRHLNSQIRGETRSDPTSNYGVQPQLLVRFTYQELEIATDHFHESRLLGCGSGASGSLIYHGLLDDGTYVAVKKIQRDSIHDFSAEFWHDIKVREKVHHPNVVNMRGYCEGGGKEPDGPPILLVFDYMPNGSVLDALLSDDDSLLSWDRRFSIALGVVMGLEYLHEHNIPPIIHGKIKPSNILLDSDFNAQLGDFGAARVGFISDRSALVGTPGFVDPEYAITGRFTEKSDVFSFGMLMLVLISGRRMMESHSSGKAQLMSWMQVLAKAELSDLVDPRLHSTYDKHQVSLCAQIVLLCTRIQPELRPSMSEIRNLLEGNAKVPISGSLVESPSSSSRTYSFVSVGYTQSSGSSFYGTSESL
ncbi:unnamed protein product [Sphagnum compactum]